MRFYFVGSSIGTSRLLPEVLSILKGIGLRLIGRDRSPSDRRNLLDSFPPLLPPPLSLLSTFVSFLATIGISVEEYEQCFRLQGGLSSLGIGMSTIGSNSTSHWSGDIANSILFLGYVRVNLFTRSPTALHAAFEQQCATWRCFEVVIQHIKEHSVSTWVRLCAHYASQFPEKKKKIINALWRTCERRFGFSDECEMKIWDEGALFDVRGVLCVLKILVATYGPEVAVFLKRFILTKQNQSYTVHQWCAEVMPLIRFISFVHSTIFFSFAFFHKNTNFIYSPLTHL